MNLTLRNEALTVVISTLGAEVQSITTAAGTELMWQADKAVWGRHAPLLFPIIGRLKDQCYTLNGERIPISQHGFARDTEFTVEHQTEHSVTLSMGENEETKKVYPFSFRLSVTYKLKGASLTKSHTVTNCSDGPMPYEIGGHDGFSTSWPGGGTMSDYAIAFPGQDALHPFGMDEHCFLTREKLDYPLTDGALPMPPRVHGLDTVVLEELPVKQVTLLSKMRPLRLTMDFSDFDYLAIWTKPVDFDTNYVCIEPWTTLPECTFVGSELTDKVGIRVLGSGESETLAYTISVEE
jgi:galactose mutarotase-like enzyme